MSRTTRVLGAWARPVLILATGAGPAFAAQQAARATQDPPPIRLVAFTNEPREPELGEVFALNLQVRVAPGVVAFFPDTLLPAPDAVSAGSGSWEIGLAPGDSLDVRATYPVMGLDPGGVLLPSLEVWTRRAATDEQAGARPLPEPGEGDAGPGLQRTVLQIGGALIMPLRAMTEAADGGLLPRPPADVLGGRWSAALVAALVIGSVVVGLLGWLLSSVRRVERVAGAAPRLPAREEALAELDRLRSLGWQANGRVVDFYDATTGVLRRFADRTAERCGTYLTSSELLGRLADRWGEASVAAVRDAVWSAERVKFGSDRPAAPAAEADWEVVRSWIAERPERR